MKTRLEWRGATLFRPEKVAGVEHLAAVVPMAPATLHLNTRRAPRPLSASQGGDGVSKTPDLGSSPGAGATHQATMRLAGGPLNVTTLGRGGSHAEALDAALAAMREALASTPIRNAMAVLGATCPPDRVERHLQKLFGP